MSKTGVTVTIEADHDGEGFDEMRRIHDDDGDMGFAIGTCLSIVAPQGLRILAEAISVVAMDESIELSAEEEAFCEAADALVAYYAKPVKARKEGK